MGKQHERQWSAGEWSVIEFGHRLFDPTMHPFVGMTEISADITARGALAVSPGITQRRNHKFAKAPVIEAPMRHGPLQVFALARGEQIVPENRLPGDGLRGTSETTDFAVNTRDQRFCKITPLRTNAVNDEYRDSFFRLRFTHIRHPG